MGKLKSVCVYCGSSNEVKPDYLRLAQDLGRTLAHQGIKLVYGGGGVGLMGACARATHSEGGEVLGIMPRFLLQKGKYRTPLVIARGNEPLQPSPGSCINRKLR